MTVFDDPSFEISQHYFVLEPSEGHEKNLKEGIITELQQIGPSKLVWSDRIVSFFSELTATEAASQKCDLSSGYVEVPYGCPTLRTKIVFFSIRNDSNDTISKLDIALRDFTFNSVEYSAFLTSQTERQIILEGSGYCLKSAFEDNGCWVNGKDSEPLSLIQPLLPGEYLHIPLHAYFSSGVGDELMIGTRNGTLPVSVSVNGAESEIAREMSDVLVLRFERMFAGG